MQRPENAISLDDYLKNQNYEKEEEKIVEKPKDTLNLQVKSTEKINEIGVSEVHKKKEKKVKEKKVQEKEEFSNFFENLKVEDNSQRRRYDNYQKKGKKEKFHFDPNDFPKF